jgi:hypothetical protein
LRIFRKDLSSSNRTDFKIVCGFDNGKQKLDVSVKYAMCVTSGVRLSKEQAFSDDTHNEVFWKKSCFDNFWMMALFASCDADAQIWHFRLQIQKVPR